MAEELVSSLEISENGFLFDPNTGFTYSLNATGVYIFSKVKENKKQEEIIACVAQDFDVNELDASKDVQDFILALKDYGLLKF